MKNIIINEVNNGYVVEVYDKNPQMQLGGVLTSASNQHVFLDLRKALKFIGDNYACAGECENHA